MGTTGRRRASTLAGLLVVVAVASACSATVSGTTSAPDWTSSAAWGLLRSIPADDGSRTEIGFVDTAALNAVDGAAATPKPTTAPESGRLPQSAYAWTSYTIGGSLCSFLDGQFGTRPGFRRTPFGDLVTVFGGRSGQPAAAIARCEGRVDPSQLGTAVATTSAAGTTGSVVGPLAIFGSGDVQTLVGQDVPASTRDAVVGGSPVPNSLADDPLVLQVVRAAPRAAALELGTVLVSLPQLSGSKAVDPALEEAVAEKGALPAAVFGGYGFVPGSGFTGTGLFITVYADEQQATTAADVLSAVWPGVGDHPFRTATTTRQGTTVVTTVPEVDPREFNLRTLRLAAYPGFRRQGG